MFQLLLLIEDSLQLETLHHAVDLDDYEVRVRASFASIDLADYGRHVPHYSSMSPGSTTRIKYVPVEEF